MSVSPSGERVAALPTPARQMPSMREAFGVWLRVALLSFGGPAGQIAVMHRILVEEKRWISEARFLHALNYCMLLPGPEAQQLATYIGWLMHRTAGGLMAGVLFVLPGVVAIMALSIIYSLYARVELVAAVFFGLKAAVLAIVIDATIRIGRRALRSRPMIAMAAAAFVAIFFFGMPFPAIIVAAAVVGFVGHRLGIAGFDTTGAHAAGAAALEGPTLLGDDVPAHARPNTRRFFLTAATWLLLWLLPVAALLLWLGTDDVFSRIAIFFSKMAMVTFGGAYAVLSYVAQRAVEDFRWLQPGEMLDGLGMAETTPGPLIMVLQFVGYMAAFRESGPLTPLTAGILGGLLTTWVTFTPCFLWIFVGAPFVEHLRGNHALSAALTGITAAVVGVILNLAVWFAIHTIFARVQTVHGLGVDFDLPVMASVNVWALLLAASAAIAISGFKVSVVRTLAACALAGVALWWAGALGSVS